MKDDIPSNCKEIRSAYKLISLILKGFLLDSVMGIISNLLSKGGVSNYPASATKDQFEIIRVGKQFPLRFTAIGLILIYAIQYPLSHLLDASDIITDYNLIDWLEAYAFVLISSLLLIFFLYIGLSGREIKMCSASHIFSRREGIGLPLVVFLFALFFLWSYLMLKLKIGMTIYSDFEPLPYRLTGFLFYGRLFFQPIIMVYICQNFSYSKAKPLVFILMIVLGVFSSLTSGSRFLGILFALPLFFLFKGKNKYLILGIAIFSYITVATLSRNFFLPFYIDDVYVSIYANEEYQSAVLEDVYILPISYIVIRSMGISEVLMTLKFGEITPTFIDSFRSFLAAFLPFIQRGTSVSVKNIYGFDDDRFGGIGLDLFSNLWVNFGGSVILYPIGIALVGFMVGRCYRLFYIAGYRFGFKELPVFSFITLFLLMFEGRSFLLIYILFGAWFISRRSAPIMLHSMCRVLLPMRH